MMKTFKKYLESVEPEGGKNSMKHKILDGILFNPIQKLLKNLLSGLLQININLDRKMS
jgi:hypothetical protein